MQCKANFTETYFHRKRINVYQPIYVIFIEGNSLTFSLEILAKLAETATGLN